jgi:hypothetical protein
MPRPIVLCVLIFATAAVGLTRPALAQSDEEQRSTGYSAIIDNIDLLVDNYTRFLARKYDLTEEQDEYTKYLLRERAHDFLDQHDDRLRVLVDQLFDVRTGGEMTQEELIQWGQQVQPIYEEAKQLIVDGNNEWREILTDEQKSIHDGDVKLMYQSFETTEEKLGRILSGEMTVEEFRSPQRRRSSSRSRQPAPAEEPAVGAEEPVVVGPAEPPPPPTARKITPRQRAPVVGNAEPRVTRPEPTERPGRPQTTLRRSDHARPEPEPRATTGGRTPVRHEPAKTTSKKPESQWEKYVREFIEKYKLNDEQSQKAHAVLEDCQAQRDRYLRGRTEQLEKLDHQVEELKKSKDKNKSNNLTQLADKRKKLMAPIDEIFTQQLKPRLERLPTRAQRRAAEVAAAKKPASKQAPEKRTPPTRKTSVRKTTVKKGKQPAEPKDE